MPRRFRSSSRRIAAAILAVVLGLAGISIAAGLTTRPARITIDGADLTVRLPLADKALGFHGDIRVPLASVKEVQAVDQPWQFLRGQKDPGTYIPGVMAYGTFRHAGGSDFVALRGRGPALVITLGDAAPFQRLVLSMPDPSASAALIQRAFDEALAAGPDSLLATAS